MIAKVGTDGHITIATHSTGTVQLALDVTGYFTAGTAADGGLRSPSLPPGSTTPTPPAASGTAKPAAIPVAGHGGVPASGVSAVVVALTAYTAYDSGYLTAYQGGTTLPGTSTLNYTYGQYVTNLALVPVGADGTINIYNHAYGGTTLYVDVTGYTLTDPPEQSQYTYNGDGLRLTKTTAGTTTHCVYDTSGTVPKLLTDGAHDYIYGPDATPLEQIAITSGDTQYYIHDQHGDTRALTTTTGTIAAAYTYTPYGQAAQTQANPTASTPLLYGGGYTDPETGFIYLIHRYYDPNTAQFTTLDPLASLTQSPYGYTYGDPLNASDASGLFCMTGVAGHNSSGGEICNGKKEVWNNAYHPLRAVATAPVSLSVFAANKWAGKDCRIDGAQWVAVCTRAFTFGDATATTFGTVINTRLNYKDFMAYNNGQLFSHELKHTDQWALFQVSFPADYLAAQAVDWAGNRLTGCRRESLNPFEVWAGLDAGGY